MMFEVVFVLCCLFHHCFAGSHKCGVAGKGPVLGGVDLVDLSERYGQDTDAEVVGKRGSDHFVAFVDNYQFWFLSSDNAYKFNKSPKDYMPQYGGYCAWGLTGYDSAITDPSGYALGGACINSTNGIQHVDGKTYWYLKEVAKHNMTYAGELLEQNINLADENFQKILIENDNARYCFNTDNINKCK